MPTVRATKAPHTAILSANIIPSVCLQVFLLFPTTVVKLTRQFSSDRRQLYVPSESHRRLIYPLYAARLFQNRFSE